MKKQASLNLTLLLTNNSFSKGFTQLLEFYMDTNNVPESTL